MLKNAIIISTKTTPCTNPAEPVPIMEQLKAALDDYFGEEFGNSCDEDTFENPMDIGIAYTEIYDDNDPSDDFHEMQISLNLIGKSFDYWLDDELIHVEPYKTLEECVDKIKDMSFQYWYSDFLDYCPEGYN